MSASKSKETECGDGVINTEGADNDSDSPVVSRTRSGRRLRTPAAKTPVRRTRKSTVREDPTESIESQQESQSEETNADPKVEVSRPVTETDVTVTVSDQTSEKENVVNNTDAGSNDTEKRAKKRTHSESSEKSKMVPLGKPKSGRVWKDRTKQRFSALVRDKPLCTSWQKKMEAKREKQLVKQFQQQLKDEQARQKEEKRKRRAENLQRRAENERKAEIVQVIKNTTKIKRMKKKQLRKIEKRDTLSMVQKTPPKVKKSREKTPSSL